MLKQILHKILTRLFSEAEKAAFLPTSKRDNRPFSHPPTENKSAQFYPAEKAVFSHRFYTVRRHFRDTKSSLKSATFGINSREARPDFQGKIQV